MPVTFLLVVLYNKNLKVRGNLLLSFHENSIKRNSITVHLIVNYLLLMPQFHISGILLMDAVSPCFQITNPLYMHFIPVASQSFLDEADK